jgi:glycosyltransferase involved in cell wall biosynthesis
MHVALVIYGALDALTGGFIYDRFLVKALEGRGHRVEVISLPWRSYARCLPDNRSGPLRRRLCAGPWDMLLQDGLAHPSLFALNRRIRAATRKPIVGVIHQLLCRQPRCRLANRFYRAIERRFLGSLDACIFTSTVTRSRARALAGGCRPDCVALPAGNRIGPPPPLTTVVERSRREGPLELLFVGNLTPVKGLAELLEALAGLDRGSWRLTVAGSLSFDRRYVRRVMRAAAARHGQDQVAFRGLLEGQALGNVFSRSHVLCMPFAHEGFGMAALEAMGFGLPVIGSAEGGVREFVRHGENGFLVKPGDCRALIGHITELHRDRRRLAEVSRAAMRAHGSWPTWEQSMRGACVFLEGLAR